MNKPMHDQSDAINNLCDAILSLKDREECLRFFDDLCTRKELQSIAQRFEVAMCSGLVDLGMAERPC